MREKALHLNPEWLRQKYLVEGLSTYDIGKIVGRNPKRIYDKLRDFGIPTRPRGENLKTSDNYMAKVGVVNPFAGKHHTDKTKKLLSEKASKPKPHIRGSKNGMSGRTGTANPNYKDGSSPERQRLYASSTWKEIVRTIYKRDSYKCARCGAGHSGKRKLHAHHIKPWAGNPELRFDLNNLITLCRPCHEWVHSLENTKHEFLG